MPLIPCHNDLRFISDKAAIMRQVAPLCAGCPLLLECWEGHKGEEAGVIAGTLPTDPGRVKAIKAGKAKDVCRNGHPKKLYGTEVDNLSPKHNTHPILGCNRCADISRFMAAFDPDNPTDLPDTPKHDVSPIKHGTEGGHRAHQRRGEDPCEPCRIARADARAAREPDYRRGA